jgi:hypothetical protein
MINVANKVTELRWCVFPLELSKMQARVSQQTVAYILLYQCAKTIL